MPVTITITKRLEPIWGTDEEFSEMTDEQIIELLQEDWSLLLDNAKWEVKREVGGN